LKRRIVAKTEREKKKRGLNHRNQALPSLAAQFTILNPNVIGTALVVTHIQMTFLGRNHKQKGMIKCASRGERVSSS
jgi:hypothetical protein